MNLKLAPLWCLALASTFASAQSITLDEALKRAIENRSTIKSALLRIEQAKHETRALGSQPAARLSLGLSSPNSLGATDEDLALELPVDVFGRTRAARAIGQAQVLLAQSNLKSVQLQVQADVLEHFAKAEAARESLEVAVKLYEVADQLFIATSRRFEEGKIPQIQVKRAEIELTRAEQRRTLATAALRSALTLLAGSIGVERIDGVSGSFIVPPTMVADLAGRPDLMALNADRAQAIAEGTSADRSRLPELSLVGLRSPWEDRRGQFGARVQLSWSVWDDGRARSEKRAALSKDRSAEAAIDDARRRVTAELVAIDTDLLAAKGHLNSLQLMIEEMRTLVGLSQKGFSEGVGTQIDVLEATRSLRELEEEAVEARLRVNLLLTQRLSVSGYVLEAVR